MKKKNGPQKERSLRLDRETIRTLDDQNLDLVKGGMTIIRTMIPTDGFTNRTC